MFAPTTLAGRALRLPLRLIPKTAAVRILSGPNRGLKWIVGAGTHGCWLGRYERGEIEKFTSHLNSSTVVWDIGAHAGFFAMACAKRCAHVVACEPDARNIAFLRRHITLNGLNNISIVEAAISNIHGGQVSFGGSDSSYQGQIGGQGNFVQTASIDALINFGFPPPNIVKMDIEGAEGDALNGAHQTLIDQRPKMLIATHSSELAVQCSEILRRFNYDVDQLNVATIWAVPRDN